MTQRQPLSEISVNQTAVILDNAPVAVYVSAADSNELLYVNELARKLFFTVPYRPGLTCYQLAGFDRPCSFCTVDKMNRHTLVTRDFHHPANGHVYRLSGKLIEWEGRPAHIEYVLDITEAQAQEDRTRAISKAQEETLRSIPCGLCVYKIDGDQISPVFHNPAFYEVMGYSEEHIHLIEQSMDFLGVHPEDLHILKEKVAKALRDDSVLRHTYRVWNDREQEYHWICLEGTIKPQQDGTKLFYGVYTDVTASQGLKEELTTAYEKMQDIINAIPGGVALYKITDKIETQYFSDGVPGLTGYTVEEYRELVKQDAAETIYREDKDMVMGKLKAVVESHEPSTFEFRKKHRNGELVWVRVQISWIGEEDGCPLIHSVFHNISETKEAQLEMDHLVNSIPGGIASYRIENGMFIPTFYSDGVLALSGHTREEFDELVKNDALDVIYDVDRDRVIAAARTAVESGETLDVSYRMRHKNGSLIWIHLNGRRMGPLAETMKFYAVFTGISAETQLFQNIANETADAIYVIDRATYDLLYVNESRELFRTSADCVGKKCYAALQGRKTPCDFCTLSTHAPDGKAHEMVVEGSGKFYSTSFRETNWNGIPAYVKYVQNVTEEVKTRREKERLEQYFETLVKNLPGGVAVVRCRKDGTMVPEFLSEGFTKMTGMTQEEAWELYGQDALKGVHPDDVSHFCQNLADFLESDESHCEIVYRLIKGDGSYLWVKNSISFIHSEDGESRIYANYHDVTKEREEQAEMRRQYKELIMQHYQTPGPSVLVLGHCNITKNLILEIDDQTDSDLLETFGADRQEFFTGLSNLVVDADERKAFRDTYLNEPSLAAFGRGDTELVLDCFIKLPKERLGRYGRFTVNLVQEPDTGDITGILTVTDVTKEKIENRILHQLSISSYDFVIDLDLETDKFHVLAGNQSAFFLSKEKCHSEQVALMLQATVVPKDKEQYARALDPAEMRRRLERTGSYTFFFSMVDANGEIRTKNMTVSAVDLRIGHVCIVRNDITDSVREQQGLLNVVAYTFELLVFIRVDTRRLTMHTRQTVLENLSPYIVENYDEISVQRLTEPFGTGNGQKETVTQFRLETMQERLAKKPSGYDFVVPFQSEDGLRYKQINVLWGDETHTTVCLVRADVTDMLAAERQTKNALKEALAQAEEASLAKSNFLSSMSHDIRTPMNAIIGMTSLARARINDPEKVEDCLQKISYSSNHLLNLINDILDMSKIERAKITLNREKISLPKLTEQLSAMLTPQAEGVGIRFAASVEDIRHPYFYGDTLRINQILINILGNAIKFTPEGGKVEFHAEELSGAKTKGKVCYCFTISDTGIGMPEDFLEHVFEPFTRSTKAARVEGTGLGLSITKGLVDLMGGEISVESRLDRGTVFKVKLECEPAKNEENQVLTAQAETAMCSEKRAIAGCHFLVVEDNAINSEILCELLQMHGASSAVRTDGSQAVAAFRAVEPGTFDAILMDIQMPVMNGYEATRAIRGLDREDAGTIPIIAMTANAFAEDVQMAFDAGMNAHVAKPIDIPKLLETLSRVLSGADRHK